MVLTAITRAFGHDLGDYSKQSSLKIFLSWIRSYIYSNAYVPPEFLIPMTLPLPPINPCVPVLRSLYLQCSSSKSTLFIGSTPVGAPA